ARGGRAHAASVDSPPGDAQGRRWARTTWIASSHCSRASIVRRARARPGSTTGTEGSDAVVVSVRGMEEGFVGGRKADAAAPGVAPEPTLVGSGFSRP